MQNKFSYKILILGPQGCGKGTQAQILSDKLGLPYFSTGNILRMRINQKDELGLRAEKFMNQGILVPDDMMKIIVSDFMSESVVDRGYVLEGYPRNIDQAKFLDQVADLTHVFEVFISDNEAVRRITGRRTCPSCQKVYHIQYNPPEKNESCDNCGVRLEIRDDDREEAVRVRLGNYYERIEPIINFYKKQGIHHKVNGEQPIAKVAQDIAAVLNID